MTTYLYFALSRQLCQNGSLRHAEEDNISPRSLEHLNNISSGIQQLIDEDTNAND